MERSKINRKWIGNRARAILRRSRNGIGPEARTTTEDVRGLMRRSKSNNKNILRTSDEVDILIDNWYEENPGPETGDPV